MRICPSCGFVNADDATTCQFCGRSLPVADSTGLTNDANPSATGDAPQNVNTTPPPTPQAPLPPPPASAFPTAPPPEIPTDAAAPSQPYGPFGAVAPPPILPPNAPPIMMAPIPLQVRRSPRNATGQFFLGLLLGMIPAVIVLVVLGLTFTNGSNPNIGNIIGYGLLAAVILYAASFIAMIVCLIPERTRWIGYGLLAAVVGSPVITFIGCLVIIAAPRPA